MVIAVHTVVGMSLCRDQDFLIPSKWIAVTWGMIRIGWMGSHSTDLKQRDCDGNQTVFGRTRRKTVPLDDVAAWGGTQVQQECVSELQNLLDASREVIASAYQVKRCGISTNSIQTRTEVVYAEGSTNGFEGRPTYFSCFQAANSGVNVMKPARMRGRKQMECLEYDDGPDEEAL